MCLLVLLAPNALAPKHVLPNHQHMVLLMWAHMPSVWHVRHVSCYNSKVRLNSQPHTHLHAGAVCTERFTMLTRVVQLTSTTGLAVK